jgi:hypothetical protein
MKPTVLAEKVHSFLVMWVSVLFLLFSFLQGIHSYFQYSMSIKNITTVDVWNVYKIRYFWQSDENHVELSAIWWSIFGSLHLRKQCCQTLHIQPYQWHFYFIFVPYENKGIAPVSQKEVFFIFLNFEKCSAFALYTVHLWPNRGCYYEFCVLSVKITYDLDGTFKFRNSLC